MPSGWRGGRASADQRIVAPAKAHTTKNLGRGADLAGPTKCSIRVIEGFRDRFKPRFHYRPRWPSWSSTSLGVSVALVRVTPAAREACRPPSRSSSPQNGKNSCGALRPRANPCGSWPVCSELDGQPHTGTYPSRSCGEAMRDDGVHRCRLTRPHGHPAPSRRVITRLASVDASGMPSVRW